MTTVAEPGNGPVPRKRHRGRTALIVLAIVVVVLVVAGIVLDGAVRSYASGRIETEVRKALSIPASEPVDVTIGGASALLQLATGKLEQVDIALPQLAIGDFTGAATLRVRGLPISAGKPIDGGTLTFSTDGAGLQKLLRGFSGVPVTSVAIDSGSVLVGASFTVIGVTIPMQIAMTPSAVNGELALTPRYLIVNGAKVAVADLAGQFGGILAGLGATQKICVASLLPAAFRLQSIRVSGNTVRLAVTAKSVVLDQSLLSKKGTCP